MKRMNDGRIAVLLSPLMLITIILTVRKVVVIMCGLIWMIRVTACCI